MRTLHLDSGREMRGGQRQVLYLMEGLRRRGHAVQLLARADGTLLKLARQEGFDAAPLGLLRLRRSAPQADIVHAHDARAHTLATIGGGPLVVSRRVAFPVKRGWMSRWKYSRASRYAAVSRFVAGKLMEAGIKSETIKVVYDGVARVPDYAGPRNPWVVAPETEDPMKGSDLLRSAAALAGIDVRFSNDLMRDLPGAGAFAYLTRDEGLGSATLLAMAHGVPVVASRVGGLPEVVEDGQSGVLVENRPEEIAAALLTILEDRALAGRLAVCAKQRVEHRFSLDRMVDDTLALYREVLGC